LEREGEDQAEGVSIGSNGVRACVSLLQQTLGEERL
jgi:hypothetical protein